MSECKITTGDDARARFEGASPLGFFPEYETAAISKSGLFERESSIQRG